MCRRPGWPQNSTSQEVLGRRAVTASDNGVGLVRCPDVALSPPPLPSPARRAREAPPAAAEPRRRATALPGEPPRPPGHAHLCPLLECSHPRDLSVSLSSESKGLREG